MRRTREALELNGHRRRIVPLAAILACTLIAAGCGDGDETTSTDTTTAGGTDAEQAIVSAIASCKDTAGQLGGVAGTTLEGACTSVVAVSSIAARTIALVAPGAALNSSPARPATCGVAPEVPPKPVV